MSFHVCCSLRNWQLYNQIVTNIFLSEAAESISSTQIYYFNFRMYRGADKSLARPGRKQDTATEDFDFLISYLES
jgi:hypothetical protein